MRSQVLEIITQSESNGVTSRQIQQKLAIRSSLQRLRGNLKRLEDLGLIHSVSDPTHRLRLIYFPGKEPTGIPLAADALLRAPIDNSQVIQAVVAQSPQGINFRSVMARCQLGISPSQMVWELRNLIENGAIVCQNDPKHKRRFLYFSVNNNVKEENSNN